MKRLTWVIVAFTLSATASFAKDNSVDKNAFSISFNKLDTYLNLDPYQRSEVANILDYFDFMQAEGKSSNVKRQEMNMKKAVYSNLKSMKNTLTDEQYKKYVTLLNITNNNTHILKEYTILREKK